MTADQPALLACQAMRDTQALIAILKFRYDEYRPGTGLDALNVKLTSAIAALEASRAPVEIAEEMVKSLREMIDAMHSYEMDVGEEPTGKHKEMMRRAEAALAAALNQGEI